MRCVNCGANNPEEDKFCGACGASLASYSPARPVPHLASSTARSPLTAGPASQELLELDAPRSNHKFIIVALVAGLAVILCLVCLVIGYVFGMPVITASLATPTATPRRARTATPGSVATPAIARKWTTTQVITAFKAAGLEAENARPLTKEDYGQIPMTASEGIRFFLPSLGASKGGRVYIFATANDMDKVKKYYDAGSGAATPPWIFVRDNVLVQLNGELKKAKAMEYQDALNGMR